MVDVVVGATVVVDAREVELDDDGVVGVSEGNVSVVSTDDAGGADVSVVGVTVSDSLPPQAVGSIAMARTMARRTRIRMLHATAPSPAPPRAP